MASQFKALVTYLFIAGAFVGDAQTPPVNDLFANRTLLTGTNITFESSLVAASEEPDEPVPPYGIGYTGRSVWWSWTAPGKGSVMITANTDLRIGVFTGENLTNLLRVTQIEPFNGGDASSLFETQAGQTYQFMFDRDLEIDPLIGSLVFTPPPVNDAFTNRIRVSHYQFTLTSPVVGADLEPGEPPHTDWWFGGRSVWYEWTPPTGGNVSIEPLSLLPRPTIDAYQGESFQGLTKIETGWNPQSFSVQKGTTYFLAMGCYPSWYFSEPVTVKLSLQPANLPSVLPPLHIQATETNALITWPFIPLDFVIESNSSLTASGNWQTVTADVITNDDQMEITLPPSQNNSFFRLRLK